MKTDVTLTNPGQPMNDRIYEVKFVGTSDEFKTLLDAFQLSQDTRVQNLSSFIQKRIPTR